MNERIKLLAEQAGFEITPWSNESVPCVHQEGPIDVELEKFAELIVNDCLSIIERRKNWIDNEDKSYNYQWIYGYEKAIGHCSMFIKEFYGVQK